MKFKKTTLGNGLRIITCEMPYTQSVTITIFVGAGSRYETKKLCGISHFLEHMVFRGTKKYPSTQALTGVIEGIGGYFGASTYKEEVTYYSKVPKLYFQKALDVLIDMVFHLKLSVRDINTERNVIIEEINKYKDIPERKVWDLIFNLIWPNEPLGRTVGGTKESVKNINRKNFSDYIKNLYKPQNIVISVAGNIKHTEVKKEAENLLGKIKKEKFIHYWRKVKVKEDQNKPRVCLLNKKTDQTHLCLGLKGTSYNNPDKFVLKLLNVILGGRFGSRLSLNIREKHGLAYTLNSHNENFKDTGLLVIYGGINTKKINLAIRLILKELNKLKNKLVSKKEFKEAKEFAKGGLILMENTNRISEFLGEQELLCPKTLTPGEMIAEIEKVTQEDIKRVANNIFRNDNLNLAIIGPFKNKRKFEEILKL